MASRSTRTSPSRRSSAPPRASSATGPPRRIARGSTTEQSEQEKAARLSQAVAALQGSIAVIKEGIETGNLSAQAQPDGRRMEGRVWFNGEQAERAARLARLQ